MLWPWRGRVTADTQNWLELAGTGATGVKWCLHYEIPEKSRSILGGASVTVCGEKRKGTGKTGNFTGKSDIITFTCHFGLVCLLVAAGRVAAAVASALQIS